MDSGGGTSGTVRQISKRDTAELLKDSGTRFDDMLSVPDRKALNSIGSVDTFPNGEVPIFHEGEHARNLYAIASGIVRISRHLANGDRQVLAFLWPGDIFGLVGEDGSYVNSADTVSAATIFRYPLNRLDSELLRNPRLQCHLLVKVNHDLRSAQRQIIALGQSDSYRRLASFLIEMMQHSGFADPDSRRIRLPMARSDIADYLGTTPETLSRGFQKMEREGIVRRVSSRVLEIEDLSGLSRLSRR